MEVQLAFFMFDLLSDVYEGMSGTYMGKDWSHCNQLFNLWEIEDPKIVMFFMKIYERIVIQDRLEEAERREKAEKRKAKSGGKNYTHNVQG
tara:strand:- start:1760 stop:2032 length:273 start_codon:yes stop_codon:yes gene_type:complete